MLQLDPLQGLQAVHSFHADIGHYQVEGLAAGRLDGLQSAPYGHHRVAFVFQGLTESLPHDRVIFQHQNLYRLHADLSMPAAREGAERSRLRPLAVTRIPRLPRR